MSLLCVPPSLIKDVWKQYRGDVAEALERGNVGTSIESVENWLFRSYAQLWLAQGGVAVTQLTGRGDALLCTLVAFTGDYRRCAEHLPQLEQFARNEGCGRFMILGRKGWKRRLPDYREPYLVLEKAL